MSQSLSHLIVHTVFSTKDRRPFLHSEDIRIETYAYMAGILKNLQCHPIKIGGVDDHAHILSSVSKNIAFADRPSQRFLLKAAERERNPRLCMAKWIRSFLSERVKRRGCHRLHFRLGRASPQISFQEELRELLTRQRVAFDERFLWE